MASVGGGVDGERTVMLAVLGGVRTSMWVSSSNGVPAAMVGVG